jgi:hypothetical protein
MHGTLPLLPQYAFMAWFFIEKNKKHRDKNSIEQSPQEANSYVAS